MSRLGDLLGDGLRDRRRAVTAGAYLWAQRRRWPVPAAVRGFGRRLLARTSSTTISGGTDDWSQPLVPGARAHDPQQRVPGETAVLAAQQTPASGGRAPDPERPAPLGKAADPAARSADADPDRDRARSRPVHARHRASSRPVQPRLRCVVATGVLDVGGMDGFVAFLGRRLPSLGINTTVVHTDTVLPGYRGTGGHLARALRSDGVPIAQLSEVDCRQWLSEHRPEVVSAHGTPDWLIAAATDTGIPVVETLHRTLLERESWARERVRSRQITAFVAVSELARRQYLVANPDYPADRVITIPNGVDDRHISHRDRARSRAWLGLGDEFLFVSLARYCLQKNPFGLLTAFSEVAAAHPQAHLLLAGRADDAVLLEQVRRLRDRLPGGDRIHLRGHCPDAAAVLAAADAFVLDSFFEGWPLASMEALFSGLPVVMSEVGGAREQVGDDGQRGYVVPNPLGDPEAIDWRGMAEARFRPQVNQAALVAAMSAVVDERDRWAAAREGLRAESVARFSAEECLRRHADVLTRAAAGTLPGLLAANTARS